MENSAEASDQTAPCRKRPSVWIRIGRPSLDPLGKERPEPIGGWVPYLNTYINHYLSVAVSLNLFRWLALNAWGFTSCGCFRCFFNMLHPKQGTNFGVTEALFPQIPRRRLLHPWESPSDPSLLSFCGSSPLGPAFASSVTSLAPSWARDRGGGRGRTQMGAKRRGCSADGRPPGWETGGSADGSATGRKQMRSRGPEVNGRSSRGLVGEVWMKQRDRWKFIGAKRTSV